jgi:hypothetical protein
MERMLTQQQESGREQRNSDADGRFHG